ncbi:riboflavin synthase alpha chain [Syntrophus gentianae]|uniref:Riboflavin synthase n=1 Tax=Syntrophus gentianae TaxID=43775 RepID=A0A1H7ZX80_9BACT|nr:riboflavin synthase [Syntrophus gentianae]SEM62109.1 riboflavin synthase alpha chain [Syntrophus gentianae]
MFTGIIQGMGTVLRLSRRGEDALLEIETAMDLTDVRIGDSIAVNGACLTATTVSRRSFAADVSAETLARTDLAFFSPGQRVNLEKALRLTDFLGGHIVLGHIDGLGKIAECSVKSGSIIFRIEIEGNLSRYLVPKGSVAVDGVSLTVNRCEENAFYVNMIPHTAEKTTLAFKKKGDWVNIETDILGKYVERLFSSEEKKEGGITRELLMKQGFLK